MLGSLAALTAEDQRQNLALLVGQRGQAIYHLPGVLGELLIARAHDAGSAAFTRSRLVRVTESGGAGRLALTTNPGQSTRTGQAR